MNSNRVAHRVCGTRHYRDNFSTCFSTILPDLPSDQPSVGHSQSENDPGNCQLTTNQRISRSAVFLMHLRKLHKWPTPFQQLPLFKYHKSVQQKLTVRGYPYQRGFCGRVVQETSGTIRRSTSGLYQAEWVIFCGWYFERDIFPVKSCYSAEFVVYLVYLRSNKLLFISVTMGY